MQLLLSARELTLKLVYYGPGLGGKTTNLAMLHERLVSEHRSRLVTLETADDRTLFFDMLPLQIGGEDTDFLMRIKVFTVPGQPIHASARRLVLGGADGVVFVADSRNSQIETNAKSFEELRQNLVANRLDIAEMPLVIQFNKRDLPKVRSDEELHQLAGRNQDRVFPAVASQGEGVVETFLGLFDVAWDRLDKAHRIEERLSITKARVIDDVARQLGADEPVDELLARRFGGGADIHKGERPR